MYVHDLPFIVILPNFVHVCFTYIFQEYMDPGEILGYVSNVSQTKHFYYRIRNYDLIIHSYPYMKFKHRNQVLHSLSG